MAIRLVYKQSATARVDKAKQKFCPGLATGEFILTLELVAKDAKHACKQRTEMAEDRWESACPPACVWLLPRCMGWNTAPQALSSHTCKADVPEAILGERGSQWSQENTSISIRLNGLHWHWQVLLQARSCSQRAEGWGFPPDVLSASRC